MNLLDHHLHRLFLDHDCIVVPGLGGFVCNRKPARYDEKRQELIPPSRTILFNERIVHHDGVLVQAIAQKSGLSLDEALGAMEAEASVLKSAMQSGKTVRIHQVGRLFIGQEGRMQFMPDEEMERILRSFGLKRIPLQPIHQSHESTRSLPAKRIIPLPRVEEQRAEAPWLRIAAAIAVPVVGGAGMFFMDGMDGDAALMSTLPVHIQTYEEARYQPRFEEEAIPVWESFAEPAAASTMVTKSEEETKVAEKEERSTSTVSIKPVVATKSDAVFLLVAGSFSVESNAQNLSKDLSEKGFDSEVFKQENGLHLVTFATHFEEGQARTNLAELRSDESTKRAWLKRVGQLH